MLKRAWPLLGGIYIFELLLSVAVSGGFVRPEDFVGFTRLVAQFVPSIADYERAMPFSEVAEFILAMIWVSVPLKLILILFSPYNERIVGLAKREYWRKQSGGTTWGLLKGIAEEHLRQPGEFWSSGRAAVMGMALGLAFLGFSLWLLGPIDLPAPHPTSSTKHAASAWLVVSLMAFSPTVFWAVQAFLMFMMIAFTLLSFAYLYVFFTVK